MNTQSALGPDKEAFEKHLLDLMYQDGFGFDEARDYIADYASYIFGKATPTACIRVRRAINRMHKEATAITR